MFSLPFIALDLAGFFLTGAVHKTALIPAASGAVLLIPGLLGGRENLRVHVMLKRLSLGGVDENFTGED